MKAAENMPNAELAKMLVDEQEKNRKLRELCYWAAGICASPSGWWDADAERLCDSDLEEAYKELYAASEGK